MDGRGLSDLWGVKSRLLATWPTARNKTVFFISITVTIRHITINHKEQLLLTSTHYQLHSLLQTHTQSFRFHSILQTHSSFHLQNTYTFTSSPFLFTYKLIIPFVQIHNTFTNTSYIYDNISTFIIFPFLQTHSWSHLQIHSPSFRLHSLPQTHSSWIHPHYLIFIPFHIQTHHPICANT